MNARLALVVDDDVDVRELVAYKLKGRGFDVLTASNGRAGLGIAQQWRPDVILLDVTMPTLGGWEVCEQLRAAPSTARIPILFMTAKAQPSDRERGFAAGADDYVVKPFSPEDLMRRVEAALARSA